VTTASQKQIRTPTIGDWAVTGKLGRRREYVLYTAQSLARPASRAYLRVLGADASVTERDRFLTEVAIVSAHKEHFLPVDSLRSHGKALVAATEIPAKTLLDFPLCRHARAIVNISLQLVDCLGILHDSGRVHGAICRGTVQLMGEGQPRVRLLDTGMGLELGHAYSATTRQRHLPPDVVGVVTATEEWDIYALGTLGLHMMQLPPPNEPADLAMAALRELFLACTAASPSQRPYSLRVIQHRLRDISQLLPAKPVRPPPLRIARFTPVEERWFVDDCLSAEEVVAIDGFAPERASTLARFFGSVLSVTAATALALMLGAMFGIDAFGY
jgi:hypothetical protein